ncbi:glucosylglycerol 3-phosphatase [Pseudomonas matsuisoli]|nr:glucosylglycerol 3-phosphatase [Pseudomonas matsuisoli]
MKTPIRPFSLDHTELLDALAATENLLIIQDLDGVCMDLVRDPLTRTLDRRYIDAANRLAGHFYVLTNGEHIGSRGVNGIIERAFSAPEHPRDQGFYLPGLAAGGVQLQDSHGHVSHPGVSDAELAFLEVLPVRFAEHLRAALRACGATCDEGEIDTLVEACVLDNLVSPTLNINACYQRLADSPERYRALQRNLETYMAGLLGEASARGLGDAFFVHYAPNLGRDEHGNERLRPAGDNDAGTTDFQFMLKGAIKEVGVLVILNHYYFQRTGRYPFGEHFNARQAPHELDALLALARERLDPAHMPRIVGVGDTVTSHATNVDGELCQLRGGSDRGFLTLVQQLGVAFDTENVILYIDSSGGEVRRPGIDAAHLSSYHAGEAVEPWAALTGISDSEDPLRLDAVFTGGHRQYVDFFAALAARRTQV